MKNILIAARPAFVHAAAFSLLVNVLMIVPALYMLQVFDRVLSSRSTDTLLLLTVVTVLTLVAMLLIDIVRARLLMTAAVSLERRLAPAVIEALVSSATRTRPEASMHGMRDVAAIRGFLTGPGILAVLDAPWLPVYLALIALFHPLLGVVAGVGSAVLVALAWTNERIARTAMEGVQTESRRSGRFIELCVRNADTVTALGMLPRILTTWRTRTATYRRLLGESGSVSATAGGLVRFARQLLQVLMLATGAYLVVEARVSAGVMIAATVLLSRALAPVESLVAGWRSLVEARSAARRLRALVGDPRPAATSLPAPTGAVAAERVVFAVPGADRPILKGITFALEGGDAVGLIGPSGSGKSTLARLLVGAWQPASGRVRLDGADLATWSRDEIGPSIGYLAQDVELFDGTVNENIARLGVGDDAEVVAAARRANAHEMILALPGGYDTPVGEGGCVLSGGQRQRIALARALYGSPSLVVLDEPNASLDAEGEDALARTLLGLKASGVTTIVISHRPSILAHVDKVIVLNDGLVEMIGPRSEIVARVTRGSVPGDVAVASTAIRRS